jgi:small-conductance mechanosensitive channel
MGKSKDTLNATLKNRGRLSLIIVFIVLIMVMILFCGFFVTLLQELVRSIFLDDIFGLTHIKATTMF